MNRIDSLLVETETTVRRGPVGGREECSCPVAEEVTGDQCVYANGEEEMMEMVSAVY